MGSLLELAASLPDCASTCFSTDNPILACVAADDLACFCKESAAADQGCLFQACPVKTVLELANRTFTTCDIQPKVNHTFVPVFIALLTAAALFVVLRWVARFIMCLRLWWDDFLNFAAYLCCIAYTVYGIMLRPGGFGTEAWAVPFENLENQLLGYYVMSLIYFTARFLVRLSILFFYMRIFRTTRADKTIRYSLYTTIIVFVPLWLVAVFQCRPVHFVWSRVNEGSQGQCTDDMIFLRAALVLLLLNDFWILILPIPFIIRLQLSWRKRFLVLAMFGMGVGVIITSIYKITLIDQYIDPSSPTTNVVTMSIWAGVEINLGVIFACLPSMPALFQPLIQRFGMSSRASQGQVGYQISGQASRYDMIDKPTISIPASVASRETDKQIRMTTTIQQKFGYFDSDIHLPLQGTDKDAIELGDTKKGVTRAKAWA